ncbi:amidase [Streptomyces beigongshangae]|uniref:amidase n=1 Tax=Streptomyces beigongshangae TaxID=2841597 RepID=UPI001C85AA2F|nr:amidase [Streptomyces sp. REN17]
MRPYELGVAAAADAIAAKELSPVELVDSVLQRAAETEDALNAYVTRTAETARAKAAQAERDVMAGRSRGPLHGIPFALKDNIDTSGILTTASSRVWADRVPAEDSAVMDRLTAAGAVLVGKTQTHEFAYGLVTPQTVNPWSGDRIVGGSSGGSAAAVAVGSATFALGTDTAGSIRVPASFNGLVGLKPTYGLVSRFGVTPLSWSMDHVGPLTRSVRDTALVLHAIAGRDPRDTAGIVSPHAPHPGGHPGDLRGVRIGVPRTYFLDHVAPQVAYAVGQATDRLVELGATAVEVDPPLTRYLIPTLWAHVATEASAVHGDHLRHHPELFGDDLRTLLEAGRLITADDYLRAQRCRTLISRSWQEMFTTIDVLATPTVASTALPRSWTAVRWDDGFTEDITDSLLRLTAAANITGLPALTLPVGEDTGGLPIGLQLIGNRLTEPELLRVGETYEAAHGNGPAASARRRTPPLNRPPFEPPAPHRRDAHATDPVPGGTGPATAR